VASLRRLRRMDEQSEILARTRAVFFETYGRRPSGGVDDEQEFRRIFREETAAELERVVGLG
jgi:hypothetical protein